jgi:hypothetical protein
MAVDMLFADEGEFHHRPENGYRRDFPPPALSPNKKAITARLMIWPRRRTSEWYGQSFHGHSSTDVFMTHCARFAVVARMHEVAEAAIKRWQQKVGGTIQNRGPIDHRKWVLQRP